MKKGDIVRVNITESANITKSIAYCEGEKILIDGGYPSQVADVFITKHKKNRTEGYIKNVVSSPEFVIKPPCTDFGTCGGCSIADITYNEQLKLKENYVKNLFNKAKLDYKKFEPIIPSPKLTQYRNKMEYSFGDEVKNGCLTLGLHKKNSHYSIVPLKNCVISPDDFNLIRNAVLEYCAGLNLTYYNQRSKTGLLRHLILRRSEYYDTLLINIVTTSEGGFNEEEFVKLILSLKIKGSIAGILHTLNDRIADVVIPEKVRVLYKDDYIVERVLGLDFRISAFSFFQTNTSGCEKLYAKALEYAGEISDKTVFDLYCGTGTIAQIAAEKAKKVYGIEIVPEAVDAAKENAKFNNLTNCEFICGDVLSEVENLKSEADVIILDPPRAGINPKALNKIIAFNPKTFVYISCKAQSLVFDLPAFISSGYEIEKVATVDMFPATGHVETVVLMTKVDKSEDI